MKLFFKKRIAFILIFFLFLLGLQFLVVFLSLDPDRSFQQVRQEVLTALIVFFLIQFSLSVLIIAQLPYYLRKYLVIFENLMSEISGGSYNIEIDINEYKKMRDKEYVNTIISFKKMLEIILRFDYLKKQKIQEQRARIIALLNLTENGFIIINKKGDVVYTNHLIDEYFPVIKEDTNILEVSFTLEIDRNIKKYITEIIRTKTKLMPKNSFMSATKRHITIKSEIIRDTQGNFDGIVIGIFNLEKKKLEADKKKE